MYERYWIESSEHLRRFGRRIAAFWNNGVASALVGLTAVLKELGWRGKGHKEVCKVRKTMEGFFNLDWEGFDDFVQLRLWTLFTQSRP
jgi:hypothetical protein